MTSSSPPNCSFDGCTRKARKVGLCAPHNQQRRNGDELTQIVRKNYRMVRDSDGRKRCSSCELWQPESDFGANASSPDRLTNQCKRCQYSSGLWSKYRITADQYDQMMIDQDGGCAICGGVNSDGRALAVDHDHACCPGSRSCGKCVRKLLCLDCNTGIGSLKDDVHLLRKAIAYLEEHNA